MIFKNSFITIKDFSAFLYKNKLVLFSNLIFAFLIFYGLELSKENIIDIKNQEDLLKSINVSWFAISISMLIFYLPIMLIGNIQTTLNNEKKMFKLFLIPFRLKTYLYSFLPFFIILLSLFISTNTLGLLIPETLSIELKEAFSNLFNLLAQSKNTELTIEQISIINNDITLTFENLKNIIPWFSVTISIIVFILTTTIPNLFLIHIYSLMFSKVNNGILDDFKKSFSLTKKSFLNVFLFITFFVILSALLYLLIHGEAIILKALSFSVFYFFTTSSLVFISNNINKEKT
jgi:hypothetical protein